MRYSGSNTAEEGSPVLPELSGEARARVEEALADILASPQFRASQQGQNLLRYVVVHTLQGDSSSLRERVIGREVFGRAPGYEPGDDPIVRIRAADLRKRLAIYYQARAEQPGVRISIPSGSYRAAFAFLSDADAAPYPASSRPEYVTAAEPSGAAEPLDAFDTMLAAEGLTLDPDVAPATGSATAPEATPDPLPEPAPGLRPSATPPHAEPVAESASGSDARPAPAERPGNRIPWSWMALAALVTLLLSSAVAAGVLAYTGRDQRQLKAMWSPLLAGNAPVLLALGSNAVYRIAEPVADSYSQQHHLQGSGMEFFPPFDPTQTLASTGLQPAPDSFVAEGDLASATALVTLLTQMHHGVQERFPSNTSFAELQANPTVLVGGFNNPMAMEFTRGLRFAMVNRTRIEDRATPGRAWVLAAPRDARDTQDFAIITRLLPANGEAPLLEVAGLGQYGTLAATHFVCDPRQVASLDRVAGHDWARHNLQLVLRIKVTDFRPAATEVVAAATW